MVSYKCPQCHKVFDKKYSLSRHLDKKIPCQQKPNVIERINRIYTCEHCTRSFSRLDVLNRHKKEYCKYPNDNNTLKNILQEVKLLKAEVDKLKVNNDKINIHIVAFGKENLDNIFSPLEIWKILEKGHYSIQEIVKQVHFNENLPEYRNFYITNDRSNKIHVFNGDLWLKDDVNAIIENIRINKCDFLIEKCKSFIQNVLNNEDSHAKEIKLRHLRNILKILTEYSNNETKAVRIDKDLKNMAYNGRNGFLIKKNIICTIKLYKINAFNFTFSIYSILNGILLIYVK